MINGKKGQGLSSAKEMLLSGVSTEKMLQQFLQTVLTPRKLQERRLKRLQLRVIPQLPQYLLLLVDLVWMIKDQSLMMFCMRPTQICNSCCLERNRMQQHWPWDKPTNNWTEVKLVDLGSEERRMPKLQLQSQHPPAL